MNRATHVREQTCVRWCIEQESWKESNFRRLLEQTLGTDKEYK